jgi:hypothetical protein
MTWICVYSLVLFSFIVLVFLSEIMLGKFI